MSSFRSLTWHVKFVFIINYRYYCYYSNKSSESRKRASAKQLEDRKVALDDRKNQLESMSFKWVSPIFGQGCIGCVFGRGYLV